MSEFIVTFYWALYMSIVAKIKCFDRIWLLQCFYIMESVSFLILYILKSMDKSELVVDTFGIIFAQMNFVSFATVNNFAQNGAQFARAKLCKILQKYATFAKLFEIVQRSFELTFKVFNCCLPSTLLTASLQCVQKIHKTAC